MNVKAPLYQSDIRPLEFTLAITIGGIGSAVLSALRVHPLVSVGFALVVMGVLSFLRWRIASEFKDFQSLEAFAEDIYLLGYLLTLAALLGLAPRLMSDDTNLFHIAGLKLVTTVVGLGLMMIFRQTARRWSEETEAGATDEFLQQQRLFTEAIQRVNAGADELTAKLNEVMLRFDPQRLVPLADWSSRAAGAFASATGTLEGIPPAVEKSLQSLSDLSSNIERVRSAAGDLASALGVDAARAGSALAGQFLQVAAAAGAARTSMEGVQPSGEAARNALTKLGQEATLGVARFEGIRERLGQMAIELERIQVTLGAITGASKTNGEVPLAQLIQALENSRASTAACAGSVGELKTELGRVEVATINVNQQLRDELSKRLGDATVQYL